MNIMRHIYLQILALLSVLTFGLVSCSKSEQGVISFDTPEMSVVSSAGTVKFIVRSNTSWTLEPSSEWVTLNITKGAQGASIIASVLANPFKDEPRTVYITGRTCDGDAEAVLTLTQMPEEPYVTLGAAELPVSSDAAEHSVDMATNLKDGITVSVDYEEGVQPWISDVKTGDGKLSFKVAQNPASKNRTAVITASGKDSFDREAKAELKVVQSLNMDPSLAEETDFSHVLALSAGQVMESVYVKGTVVLDGKNPNFNEGYYTIQNAEGQVIVFKSSVDLGLKAGDGITLWLLGADLQEMNDGDAKYLLFSGIGSQHIMKKAAGTPVEPLPVHISELSESMLYRLVKLQDVEFSIPFGGYVNYNEYYITGTGGPLYKDALVQNYPQSVRDVNGDHIYMLTNFSVSYRSKSLPQGSGSLTGIVVSEKNSNMGNIGRFQIRHIEESDIALAKSRSDGFTDVLVEWDFAKPSGFTDGQKTLAPSAGQKNAVFFKSNSTGFYGAYNKEKEGEIYFTEEYRGDKFTNAAKTANTYKNCAVSASKWDTNTYWYINNVSTVGINGTLSLQFASNSLTSTGPAFFIVEWSLDGNTWTPVENGEYQVMGQCTSKVLRADHMPGHKVYDFRLPSELNNQNNIQLRLRLNSYVNVVGATVASLPASATNRLTHLSIKYNK